MQQTVNLQPRKVPNEKLALTNCVCLSQVDLENICAQPSEGPIYVAINGCVFSPMACSEVQPGAIGLSEFQRRFAKIPLNQQVSVRQFVPPPDSILGTCSIEVDFPIKPGPDSKLMEIHDTELEELFRKQFEEQVLSVGQLIALHVEGAILKFTIMGVERLDLRGGVHQSADFGLLSIHTELNFKPASLVAGKLRILSNKMTQRSIFRSDFNFEELGIGGLSSEFREIFRRTLAARLVPPLIVRKLGAKHVKGMLLYGPPGTGKTLIARQLAKFLNAATPKIISGPEILNKYVGQGEENVRKLFEDAEADERLNGENSQLHVIILDEMDAICKKRGSSSDSTGSSDNIVNQFLAKIDGVEALDNVLLIGMTNRKEMLDPALLRPGRLEVHVEIGLPDETGRVEILNIHTAKMKQNDLMEEAVSIQALASQTRNFSPAELEGLVRSAQSFAMSRQIDLGDLSKCKDVENILVTDADFRQALGEIKPMFGQDNDALGNCIDHGIVLYSPEFEHVLQKCMSYVHQVRGSDNSSVLSVLLSGTSGCGKTALAAHLAQRADYPFTRRITNENLAGYSEQAKIAAITQVFEDAHKSPLSLVILDDLERLLDYVCIGPRFSNALLQLLFGVLKKRPAKDGHRMLVLGTTSDMAFIKQSKLLKAFTVALMIPVLEESDHFKIMLQSFPGYTTAVVEELCKRLSGCKVGVRTLLEAAEMASQQQNPVHADIVMECLRDAGVFDEMPEA